MQCRLCGNEHSIKKYTINRFDPPFLINECAKCGFLFQDAGGDPGRAYSFYDEGYYTGTGAYTYIDERKEEEACRVVWKKRVSKWMKWDRSGKPGGSFLDVGCSFGGLMKVAEESGLKPYGIEVSLYSGAFAKKRFGGDSIFIGSVEDVKLPENEFSIVSLIEVIEHVHDIRKAIGNIYASMKKGGVLIIQTADMEGLQAKLYGKKYGYFLPGHLSYFSRNNLAGLLKSAGFSRIKFIGGVEFGLLSKLIKSGYGFKKWTDYLRWIKISTYHLISKAAFGRFHMTSSMVMAAWK
jgi:SAM-dependent methyltransferase